MTYRAILLLLQFGAKNFLVRTCAGLPSKIELYCDDQLIFLPEGTEGVIVLNINSYGGGSTLWHDESDSEEEEEEDEDSYLSDDDERTENGSIPSEYDEDEDLPTNLRSPSTETGGRSTLSHHLTYSSPHDGLLDVVAVYGTLHLGQMQVGLSKAVRLCQCKKVRVKIKEKLPVQIDGEPWQQEPCELDVSYLQQAFMLSRTVEERDFVTRKVGEVLDWAENTGVINSSQRDVLLAEIAKRVVDEAITTATGSAAATAGAGGKNTAANRRASRTRLSLTSLSGVDY
jgi:diacylglycerol kinase (ATP)